MAINPKIKERAERIRKEVYGKDVREALASGLEVMSEDVEETKQRQDNVESQFQAVLDETTEKDVISAPEVTAARVGVDGTQHMNLKQRLDSEHDKITAQLAQNAYYHEVNVSKHYDEISGTDYYLTLIKHRDEDGNIIKLKRGFMEGDNGETVRSFANRIGATVAINASTFDINTHEFVGTDIYNSVIQKEAVFEPHLWILGIKEDNTLVSYRPGTPAQSIIDDGCTNALTAFMPIIENGVPFEDDAFNYDPNHFNTRQPRQIIAQFDNKDLLILTCGGRDIGGNGMNLSDLVRILMNEGVSFAFMLDGGGSTQTVVRGSLINKPLDDNGFIERKVPDYLYISKEVPSNRDKDIVLSNQFIGELNKKISDLSRILDLMGTNTEIVNDLNNIKKNGPYWANAGLTANSPDTSISWGVFHFQVDSSALQIAFPFSNNTTYKPMQRRTKPAEPNEWYDWRGF